MSENAEPIRVTYTSDVQSGAVVELPFRVLVITDLGMEQTGDDRGEVCVTDLKSSNINEFLSSRHPTVDLVVSNELSGLGEMLQLRLTFSRWEDFEPRGIIRQVRELKSACDCRAALAKKCGLSIAQAGRYSEHNEVGQHTDASGPDSDTGKDVEQFEEMGMRVAAQLDAILHHPSFRKLERSWRSLDFLVKRIPDQQGVLDKGCFVSVLNTTKQELIEDFEDAADVVRTNLYRLVYTAEFGQYGGQPYGVILLDHDFDSSAKDLELAKNLSTIASMAHAPCLSGVSAAFLGLERFEELGELRDLDSYFDQPKYAKWRGLRETENARYLYLTIPRFVLRKRCVGKTGTLVYREGEMDGRREPLYGTAAFALVTRLAESFSAYRWCLNITGVEEGRVRDLRVEIVNGEEVIPTEIKITDQMTVALARCGFVPMVVHEGSGAAVFYAADSVQRVSYAGVGAAGREDGQENMGKHLGAQLPYLLLVCRFAHYLKVIQRDNLGKWKNKLEIEQELNSWLKNYITDMGNPPAAVRSRRPLRRAHASVIERDGQPDWYLVKLSIMPHIRYFGKQFSLNLHGRLERK